MKNRNKYVLVLMTLILATSVGCSGGNTLRIEVSPVKMDCKDIPVHTDIALTGELANVPAGRIKVELRQSGSGTIVPGQIVIGSEKKPQLWWVIPQLKAGQSTKWVATLTPGKEATDNTFAWQDKKENYLDLLFNDKKVMRYMYAYDTSSKQRRLETCKVFHHFFDAQGKNLITNGPDGVNAYGDKILYPHHRGLFIGWNKLEFMGKKYDLWHMGGGESQRHQKVLQQIAGPVLARLETLIHWNNKDNTTIVSERRQITAYRQNDPAIVLLDFHVELKGVGGEVYLNGDSEHGGCQYRPHNDVATGMGRSDKKGTAAYLFHRADIDPKKDKDLPWVALSYPLNNRRYNVQHLNHPGNPTPTVYSAYRGYGRFGTFFKKKIPAGETLMLNYRILVTESEMPDREAFTARYETFANAPKAKVSSF